METDNKSVTTSGLHQFMTADGNDFIDICTAMGIQRDMWRIYYRWLDEVHCYGHRHRTSENGMYFYNPWRGVGHKAKLNPSESVWCDPEFPGWDAACDRSC